ncbi:anthranilate synthase component 1 [Corynebacterium sp. 13CS0277]|uniref:anthranilate synthase component 1 n=1 Tax=Corynebacterium sp. 13CS0277 TaxID=2071994 RepID=UPI000D026E8A|nr:anthranilate synthase component 1 [Corynebacterium sp. 13CS0277]PRQ11110.1 anthranilate synthase component 1 [Corynebacterium sp. 13CS0277]
MQAHVARRSVAYHDDASALFAHLGGTRATDSVLLESADIESKVGLQSMAVLAGSLRLTCEGDTVTLEPLTDSGAVAAQRVAAQCQQYLLESDDAEAAPGVVRLRVPAADATEERQRLLQDSTVLPLRLLQRHSGYSDGLLPLLAGGFAFDYLGTFETLPEVAAGVNTYPDYQFLLAEVVLRIDHTARTAELVAVSLAGEEDAAAVEARLDELAACIADFTAPALADPAPQGVNVAALNRAAHVASGNNTATAPVSSTTLQAVASRSDESFRATVTELQGNIAAGDIYQVVPARSFTIACPDAFAAYTALKRTNPSPYMFYVRGIAGARGERHAYELFGASPESNLKYTESTRQVELYPIAGTRPRGLHADGSVYDELDIRRELELRTDAKEIAEHVMLVDLARNDLARVATPATRRVAQLLHVDRYSRVMHLISRVTARLADDLDSLDAYRACMNMGTLTGAPKIRATELLRTHEGTRRGSYGGAVGYLNGAGDMDTCIVIRSAFVRDGIAAVQAGAGVVRDSQPQAEADETVHKAFAVLGAIAAANHTDVEVVR